MLFPSGRSEKTEGYGRKCGARCPERVPCFLAGIFPVRGFSVIRKELLRQTSAFYIYLIFMGSHPPGGLPKTGGHGILQYIIVEK